MTLRALMPGTNSFESGNILNMVERMVNETMPEVEVVEDNLDTVYPWRPFPVDLLPETVSRFIAEVSNANGCDPAGVAIATLVVLATAIGNSNVVGRFPRFCGVCSSHARGPSSLGRCLRRSNRSTKSRTNTISGINWTRRNTDVKSRSMIT